MAQVHLALLLEEAALSLQELAASCAVNEPWIVEHVRAGVLLSDPDADPGRWVFSGSDLLRARRLSDIEHKFDANPELAGLVADLLDELERLRTRLRRAGIPFD